MDLAGAAEMSAVVGTVVVERIAADNAVVD